MPDKPDRSSDSPGPKPKSRKQAKAEFPGVVGQGLGSEPKTSAANTATSLDLTKKGEVVAEQLKRDARRGRANFARRRRATAIDRGDFEAAFDDLVHPVQRPKRLALIGDLCTIVGGGFLGFSLNVYTGSGTFHQIGQIAFLAGLILSLVGAGLKYLDPTK